MLARSLPRVGRGALLAALISVCVALPARGADTAIAIVSSLSGSAQMFAPSGGKKTLSLFDWLPAGTVIEVGPSSKVSLTYANGNCYSLEEGTKATITASGPEASAGKVSPLNSVPALPRLAALANAAGTRLGANRIRGGGDQIRNLYPSAESAALPEETVLRFTRVEDATRYRVDLQDETGRTIFDIETQSSEIPIPAGVLRAGGRYHWRVRTVDRMGPAVWADSDFSTLPEEDIHRRTVLRNALVKTGDAESLALLAEIDRRLGLLTQAQEEFRSALSKAPDNTALQKALTEIDKELTEDQNKP
jgi:hypothetical protein